MVHFSRRLALKSALVCALVSLFFNTAAAADAVLRVSAIPDEAPTELQRKFAPVSYTHLDVYKRQPSARSSLPFSGTR